MRIPKLARDIKDRGELLHAIHILSNVDFRNKGFSSYIFCMEREILC